MRLSLPIIVAFLLAAGPLSYAADAREPGEAYETRTVRVPGTTVSFEMVRCPAPPAAAADGGAETGSVWVLRTEVPWELYDVFVYELDRPDAEEADAVARPSKPYVPPDRGFGHDGYPAMGMTRQAAEKFCVWLSGTTGVSFRLPTAAEWEHLARGGDASDAPAGEDAAWSKTNANFTTHPVGGKAPNAFGLHDMLGNVAEWVTSDARRPVAMGGSYRDAPEACLPGSTQQQDRSWNASDPQIPKSAWWLADCSWVGFRFLTTDEMPEETADDE